jgi:hypothetical protein
MDDPEPVPTNDAVQAGASMQKAPQKKATVHKTRAASKQKDDPVPAKVVAEKPKGQKKDTILKTKVASKQKVVEQEDDPVPAKAVTAKPKGQKKDPVPKTKAASKQKKGASKQKVDPLLLKPLVVPHIPNPKATQKKAAKKKGDSIPAKLTTDPESPQLKSPPEDTDVPKVDSIQDIKDIPSDTVNSAPEKGKHTKSHTESDSEDYDTGKEEDQWEYTPAELDCISPLEVVKCHDRNDNRAPIVHLCMFFVCLLYIYIPLTLLTFIFFVYVTAALPPIYGWVCACLQLHAGEALVAIYPLPGKKRGEGNRE